MDEPLVKPTDLKALPARLRSSMLSARPGDVDLRMAAEDPRPALRRFGARGPELLEWIVAVAAVAAVVALSLLVRR